MKKSLYQRHTEYQENKLRNYIENQINHAFDSGSEQAIHNVYQAIYSYKTAFSVTDQENFRKICMKYIDAIRIMAKREGVQL